MTDEYFSNRLLDGERVLWSGQPARGLSLRNRDVFQIPFSLLWCGFAVFWTISASQMNAPWFFIAVGGFFVCMGLYFVVGRFLFDSWLRSDMRYAVTNLRILIMRPEPFGRFTALALDRLPAVDLNERIDGSGSIRFGVPAPVWGNRGWTDLTPALDPTPQFLMIDDARRVFDLIQENARKSATA